MIVLSSATPSLCFVSSEVSPNLPSNILVFFSRSKVYFRYHRKFSVFDLDPREISKIIKFLLSNSLASNHFKLSIWITSVLVNVINVNNKNSCFTSLSMFIEPSMIILALHISQLVDRFCKLFKPSPRRLFQTIEWFFQLT